jgi:hypothetical protein
MPRQPARHPICNITTIPRSRTSNPVVVSVTTPCSTLTLAVVATRKQHSAHCLVWHVQLLSLYVSHIPAATTAQATPADRDRAPSGRSPRISLV